MRKILIPLLVIAVLIFFSAGCTTPSTQPGDLGNMMPEGKQTGGLLGYYEMCADPERYQPELCPAKEPTNE